MKIHEIKDAPSAHEQDIALLRHLLKVCYKDVGRDRLVDIVSDVIEGEELASMAMTVHRERVTQAEDAALEAEQKEKDNLLALEAAKVRLSNDS